MNVNMKCLTFSSVLVSKKELQLQVEDLILGAYQSLNSPTTLLVEMIEETDTVVK